MDAHDITEVVLAGLCIVAMFTALLKTIFMFNEQVQYEKEQEMADIQKEMTKNNNVFIAYYQGCTFIYADVPETKEHFTLDTPRHWKLYLSLRKDSPKMVRLFHNMNDLRTELYNIGCLL